MGRNYQKEYKRYQGKPEQIARRSARNKARRAALKNGSVKKGDGKDIHHKDGNPTNNSPGNTVIRTASSNRSFPRNKNAGKA